VKKNKNDITISKEPSFFIRFSLKKTLHIWLLQNRLQMYTFS